MSNKKGKPIKDLLTKQKLRCIKKVTQSQTGAILIVKDNWVELFRLLEIELEQRDILKWSLDYYGYPSTLDFIKSGLDKGTLLHDVVRRGCTRTIELMLNHGYSVNLADELGRSPLHIAVSSQEDNIIMKILLAHGADAEQIDNEGMRPIHHAVIHAKNSDCVKCLLEHGVDINAQDNAGWSVLHIAISMNHPDDLVKLLIQSGAGVDLETKLGWSPLEVAIFNRYPKKMKILLDNGANAERRGNFLGGKPIHLAASRYGGYECVECLLQYNINLNDQDAVGGYTALHTAASSGSLESARLLLDAGADLTIETNNGRTSFQVSQMYEYEHGIDMVRIFAMAIMKNNAAGLRVSKKDLRIIRNTFGKGCSKYEDMFKEELKKMKEYKICSSHSLYDIFVARSPRYRANKTLVDRLKTIDFKEFPKYGNMLRKKISEDEKRYKPLAEDDECLIIQEIAKNTTVDAPEAHNADQEEARSPARSKSKSPVRSKAKSSAKHKAKSPIRPKARSPTRPKAKSPDRSEAKSVAKHKAKPPAKPKAKSPARSEIRPLVKSKAQPLAQPRDRPKARPEAEADVPMIDISSTNANESPKVLPEEPKGILFAGHPESPYSHLDLLATDGVDNTTLKDKRLAQSCIVKMNRISIEDYKDILYDKTTLWTRIFQLSKGTKEYFD